MADKRIRIILDSKNAEAEAKKLDKAVTGIGAAADSSIFSLNKLAAAISGAIAVDKLVGYADAFTSIENQIKRTTTTTVQLSQTTSELLKVANDTRTGIADTTELYTSLSVATKGLGYTQEQIIGTTKTINNLFLVAGKSAQESAGAIRQLGQALQSGVLRGDEFNSVAEGAPGILEALRKATGKSAAELRAWAETGAISAKLIVDSLQDASSSAQDAADKVKTTFSQSATVAENNAIAFVGSSREIGLAVDAAGKSIVTLSENLDILTKAGVALGAIYVARLIPSVLAYTTAVKSSVVTQLLARDSMVVFGAATATTLAPLTAAKVATNALAVSAGALRGALAFLGGPVGVAFLAATALFYFGTKAEEARTPVDELTKSTEGLSNAQKELTKLKINTEITAQVAEIEDASKKLLFLTKAIESGTVSSVDGIRAGNEEITKQKARLDEARASANALYEALAKITPAASGGASPATPKPPTKEEIAAAKKAYRELLDIQSEFWDAVDAEGKQRDTDAEIMNRQKNNTDTLRAELNTRVLISRQAVDAQFDYQRSDYERQLAAIQNQQALKMAELQKSIEAENQTRANQRANELEFYQKNNLDDSALKAEFLEQDKIIAKTHEEELFTIRQDGVNAIADLDRAEREARLANAGALGNALMSLGQGQSKKIFKIGQTLALAQAAVALPSAVIQSFNNGGGYPWGLIPAAAMLATGLKNINDIRSAGAGLGGGGGGSVPTPSLGGGATGGGPGIPSNVNSEAPMQQKRVIELRGIGPDSLINGDQLAKIFESDDNVVIAFEGAREDAARRNVIGVNAR